MMKADASFTKIRLQERAQDDEWVRACLQRLPFGMLATEWQGQSFIKPTLFVYDQERNAIYFHGALEGRMRTNLEANPRVCFCVAEMGRLLPAKTSMEFGVEYGSAVVFGTVAVLDDEAEARRALQLLLERYFPHLKAGEDYQDINGEELAITAVYRIDIEQWSGKAKYAQPDFPGAFYFEAMS